MDSITQYFQLAARRPELFAPSDQIPLCMDEETLRGYSASTGRPVGVVYDNSPYYFVLADLCIRENGELYTYARVVYPHKSNGVVVIPCRNGRFGLLSIFRHPPRMESGGEFPRGFGEDLTPAENGAKELWEELGVRIAPEELEFWGRFRRIPASAQERYRYSVPRWGTWISPPTMERASTVCAGPLRRRWRSR